MHSGQLREPECSCYAVLPLGYNFGRSWVGDLGGPSLRSVTPYRAAKLAARRSRPGRKPASPPRPVTVVAAGARGTVTAIPPPSCLLEGRSSKLAARKHQGAQRDRDGLTTHSCGRVSSARTISPSILVLPGPCFSPESARGRSMMGSGEVLGRPG
jgi:hypothetical protein